VGICRDLQEFCSLDPQRDVMLEKSIFSEILGACFILIVCIISQNGNRMERYVLKRVLGPGIFKIQTARDSEQ